jgi:hypothetical protein
MARKKSCKGVTRAVNMRLPLKTIEKIDEVRKKYSKKNRTQTFIFLIDVARGIFDSLSEGERICIEKPDGTKEYLRFIF